MKKNLLLISIIQFFFFASSFAQKETFTWYFGWNAGIDFNSGSAVALTNGGMGEYEGCSNVSHKNSGAILFYTEGLSVWSANHNIMPNGTGLQTTYASGQEALIVPDPADTNQYYIFTAGEYYSAGVDGYRYNIVDMTLNGGLGDVTSTKNVLLYTPATEKLCAIKNAAGDGYWIATHRYTGDKFAMYELTAAGLSAPVISAVGTSYSGTTAIGCMKFSPDGTRLATVLSGLNAIEVYDFDPATGIVSNAIFLDSIAQLNPYVYGISFSPSGKRVYVTEENDNQIYQFDLTAGSQQDINSSEVAVGITTSYAMQTLQLAPDGKMYVARNGASYLAVINDPDSLGIACNFVDNGFYLAGKLSSYGLPNFPEAFSIPSPPLTQINFAASDTDLCEKFCISFFDSSTNNPASWQWTFEGGSPATSSDQNPVNICYDNPGIFDVILITTDTAGNTDTLILSEYITVFTNPFAPVITQAGNVLTASPADSYQWQLNNIDIPGATNQSYEITQSGLFTVIIADSNGCSAQADYKASLTDLEEISESDIVIYPNPSEGNFIIQLLNGQMAEWLCIRVVNALGQEVYTYEEEITSAMWRKEIDLSYAAAGVYFIEINIKDEMIRKKVLIAK